MKRVFEVAFAVAFILGVLVSSARNTTHAQVGQRYDTPFFSVQFPAGANVELKDDRLPGKNWVTHFYLGYLSKNSSANVFFLEFPEGEPAQAQPEATFSKGTSKRFAPGFWTSPITTTTVGGLQGYKQTIRGRALDDNSTLVARWRLAVSQNRTRVWFLETLSGSDEDLPEADCEKFFDSLKIK